MWREGGKKDISSTYIHMYKGEEGDAGNWHTFNAGKVAVKPEEPRSRPWLASLGRRRTFPFASFPWGAQGAAGVAQREAGSGPLAANLCRRGLWGGDPC